MVRHMKRPKRIWPVALIGLGLLIALFVFNSYRGKQSDQRLGEERLEAAIRQMENHVPNWQTYYEDRNRRLAPENHNSAFLLRNAWIRTPVEMKKWLIDNLDLVDENGATIAVMDNERHPTPAIEAVSKWVDANPATVDDCRQLHIVLPASGFPYSRKIDLYNLYPLDQKSVAILSVGRLLQRDAWLQVERNRPDQAVLDCRAMLGLSRILGDEPSIETQRLRKNACYTALAELTHVLGCTEPNAGLAELQTELAAEAESPFDRLSIISEFVANDDLYRELDRPDPPDLRTRELGAIYPPYKPTNSEKSNWQNEHRTFPLQRAYLLEVAIRNLGRQSMSWGEKSKQWTTNTPTSNDPDEIKPSFSAGIGGTSNWYSPELQAEMRIAVILIACERFRIANGRWPNDLAEIPKSILPAVPIDPYDDKPLRIKRNEKGLIVYSVSTDGIDNGGREIVSNERENDQVIQLFDPKFRRIGIAKAKPESNLPGAGMIR